MYVVTRLLWRGQINLEQDVACHIEASPRRAIRTVQKASHATISLRLLNQTYDPGSHTLRYIRTLTSHLIYGHNYPLPFSFVLVRLQVSQHERRSPFPCSYLLSGLECHEGIQARLQGHTWALQ